MAWFMGIDIGSGTTKGVITQNSILKAFHLIPSGVSYRKAADKLREELLTKLGLLPQDIAYTVVTGQGAGTIPFSNEKIADIRCCARGIAHLFPSARTIIDVQGQSCQVIRIDEQGLVVNFVASEKCAGGSGRFLDVIANVLQIKLEDIGALSLQSKNPVVFNTGCAVFGESEVVSRVAEGVLPEDILAGVHQALTDRISTLVDRVGMEEACVISGGGALNIGLIKRVEDKLGIPLLVPEQPQIVNALGASTIAEEHATK